MDVKIEKLVYGGEGLARQDGLTIFIPFVLPEERVRVRPPAAGKKKFVRARMEELLEPSPARAAPRCPHFTVCGGCHYQHIPYERQLGYKEEILRETLRRLGRIEWTGPVARHASPEFGYRNRAQWKARAQAGAEGRVLFGYNQAGSGALVSVRECPILAPRLERAMQALAALVADGSLDATLREAEAFTDAAGERLQVTAAFSRFKPSADELAEVLRGALGGPDSLLLFDAGRDRFELYGPGWIPYDAAGASYRVGHLSFFQVNRHLVDAMVAAITPQAAGGGLALDLFAGVGLFSAPLARVFERVVAVEANPAAARDLEENLKPHANARAVAREAGEQLAALGETPDLVVLDPPRAGLDAAVLTHLARLAPPRIHYLSCDPATLARDLATLAGEGGGWRIAAVEMFDVFPQSFHIETLVRLERTR